MDENNYNNNDNPITPDEKNESVQEPRYEEQNAHSTEPVYQEPLETQPSYAEPVQPTESFSPDNHYGYEPQYNEAANETPVKELKRKSSIGIVPLLIIVLVVAIISGSLGGAISLFAKDDNNKSSVSTTDNASNSATNVSTNSGTITIDGTTDSVAAAVYAKCVNSVVGIRTTTSVASFFGTQQATGEGSGVIYSADGYIITNFHVIADSSSSAAAENIQVFLQSAPDTGIDATVVGYNISADIAVLKIDKTGLTPITFASSSKVAVGQFAIAIGSPGGLDYMNSCSSGIVSGLNREVKVDANTTMKLVQVDTAINPGNSGGALLNSDGELIGINSSKFVSESIEGMGFAIPSDSVKKVYDTIMNNKNNPSAYVGVEVSSNYSSFWLTANGYPAGAVVSNVDSGSPAYKAGLQRADIITEVNGKEVSDYNDYADALKDVKPKDEIKISYYRSGKTYDTTLTVGSNVAVTDD